MLPRLDVVLPAGEVDEEALARVADGQALEKEADVGKAIKAYEEANAVLQDAQLTKRIERLRELWKPKNDAHAEARQFIYDRWPDLDVTRAKAQVKEAQKAFEVVKQAGDALGTQKLLKAAVGHVGRLQKRKDELQPDVNEDDRKPAEELAEALEDLGKLIGDASAYLERARPKDK